MYLYSLIYVHIIIIIYARDTPIGRGNKGNTHTRTHPHDIMMTPRA